mmetsp:Transcript_19347/g.39175  ORF Transcript_19347/g.39175 Transcript_19347/m.39175 type:complete len:263 (-) Transcript_19347:199-987(-)
MASHGLRRRQDLDTKWRRVSSDPAQPIEGLNGKRNVDNRWRPGEGSRAPSERRGPRVEAGAWKRIMGNNLRKANGANGANSQASGRKRAHISIKSTKKREAEQHNARVKPKKRISLRYSYKSGSSNIIPRAYSEPASSSNSPLDAKASNLESSRRTNGTKKRIKVTKRPRNLPDSNGRSGDNGADSDSDDLIIILTREKTPEIEALLDANRPPNEYRPSLDSPLTPLPAPTSQHRPCRYGMSCYRPGCWFDHPPGWDPLNPK